MAPTDATFVNMALDATRMCETMLRGVKAYKGGFVPLSTIRDKKPCSISLEVANRNEAEAARMGLFSANDNTRDTDSY